MWLIGRKSACLVWVKSWTPSPSLQTTTATKKYLFFFFLIAKPANWKGQHKFCCCCCLKILVECSHMRVSNSNTHAHFRSPNLKNNRLIELCACTDMSQQISLLCVIITHSKKDHLKNNNVQNSLFSFVPSRVTVYSRFKGNWQTGAHPLENGL